MGTWSKVFRTYDTDTILTVTKIVVDTWNEMVLEVGYALHDKEHGTAVEEEPPPPRPTSRFFLDNRADKIKTVQDFLRSNGVTKGEWFEHPHGIPDSAVRMAYSIISEKQEDKERMNRVLKNATRGDRFGSIHDKTTPNVEFDW